MFQTELEFEVVVFKERGKLKLNLQASTPGFEAEPYCFWWEASALTTAPLLLPKTVCQQYPTIKYFLGTDKISHTTQSLSPLYAGEISPYHSGKKLPLLANTGCSKHFSNILLFRVPGCKAASEKGT